MNTKHWSGSKGVVAKAVLLAAASTGLAALALLSACSTPALKQWRPLQAADLAQPLTLERCLALARTNDVKVEQWDARLAAARAQLRGARAIPNPKLELSWEDVGMRDPAEGALDVFKIGASYPIFFWWIRPYEIAVAQGKYHVQMHTVYSDRGILDAEVGKAFITLLTGQMRVGIAEETLAIARQGMRLVAKEREIGEVSGYEVDRAQAELLDAESKVAEARAAMRVDALSFAFALGADRPLFPQVAESDDLSSFSIFDEATSDTVPDSIVNQALVINPDWTKAEAQMQQAEAELALQQRRAVPLADAEASALRVNDPGGKAWDFGFGMPLPFFNWNLPAIRQAEAELRTARAEQEQARRAVVAALAEAWARGWAAYNRWRSYASRIADIRARNERAATKLFVAGQIGYNELLQTRRDLNEARLAELEVWQEAAFERFALALAMGQYGPPTPPSHNPLEPSGR
jgi:multidrug efflux system outer membrane protein